MKRISYNADTGEIINIIEAPNININHIDLTDDDKSLDNVAIFHIDAQTKAIVIDKMVDNQPTYEDLQQQLLIAQGVI